ncbi:MAG: hypothetical protein H6823_11405 [Planctomycetaceae bacterium]|nr:hypothetical protein [Planctomycetaceae bacterium]
MTRHRPFRAFQMAYVGDGAVDRGSATGVGSYAPEENRFGLPNLSETAGRGVDFVCVATPDDRHSRLRKPPRSRQARTDRETVGACSQNSTNSTGSLAKRTSSPSRLSQAFDPDHRLRTLVHDKVMCHVNNGYCSLLNQN